MSLSLTIGYAINLSLPVAMIAMTDAKASQTNFKVRFSKFDFTRYFFDYNIFKNVLKLHKTVKVHLKRAYLQNSFCCGFKSVNFILMSIDRSK